MIVSKIIFHNNFSKNNTFKKFSKQPSFAGQNGVPKTPEDILNYLASFQTNLKACIQNNDDNNKMLVSNYYDYSFKNETIKEFVLGVISDIKSEEQQKILKKIVENDNLINEDNSDNIKRIIQMASNPTKYLFISKILDNNHLSSNKRLLAQLPFILHEDNFDDTALHKISVLDKILSYEKLVKNEVFMEKLPEILSMIDSKLSEDILNRVFDCVLDNPKCANSEKFIGALGNLFSLQEFHRRYGNVLNEIELEFGKESFFANVLGAISQVLDENTLKVFEKLIDDKSFVEDKSLLVYFPSIVSWGLYRNVDKLDTVLKYLRKNVSKQSQETNKKIVKQYMYSTYYSIDDIATLTRVNEKAIKQKHLLKSSIEDLLDSKINDFFDYNRHGILSTINLLGEKVFVHSYSSKLNGVQDLCNKCCIIQKNLDKEIYEQLLLKINPLKSEKYQGLQKDISLLKKDYLFTKNNKSVEELKALQNKINTKTKEAKNLLDNKLSLDPDSIIKKIRVLYGVVERENVLKRTNDYSIISNEKSQNDINKFIMLLNNSTFQNDSAWNQAIYENIFNNMDLDFDEKIAKEINLAESKYIGEILSANPRFFKGLKDIFELVKLYPDKSVTEIFDNLEQNKITKQLFEKYGINYDKWVGFDKNSYVDVNIKINMDKVKNVAKNDLDAIFSDDWYHKLPQELKDSLLYALAREGIYIKNVNMSSEPIRYAVPNSYSLQIENDDMLRTAINVIKNELSKDIWIAAHLDTDTDEKKEYISNLFLDKISKIQGLLDAKTETSSVIKIQKVDMNNIAKSLFLGNDASCCTSVRQGREQATEPKYVKNKMFSAIEILDNNKPVGNTMCYFALVNGKLSLVLDNIEFKLKYRHNDLIRDGIIEYAKKLCKEVGVPNIPIYLAGLRNKINIKDEFFEDLFGKLQPVGNTGCDYVYLDFLNTSDQIDFSSKVYTSVCITRVA